MVFLHLKCVDAKKQKKTKKNKVGGMRMRQDELKHLVEICASNVFFIIIFFFNHYMKLAWGNWRVV